MKHPIDMDRIELRALDNLLADERRRVEDYRGALIAWDNALTMGDTMPAEMMERRRTAVLDAKAVYDGGKVRTVDPLSKAETDAISWCEAAWWLPKTKARVFTIIAALRARV